MIIKIIEICLAIKLIMYRLKNKNRYINLEAYVRSLLTICVYFVWDAQEGTEQKSIFSGS